MNAQELKHRARLEEWKERVAACRSSGMSVRGWCQEQGIAYKTYYYNIIFLDIPAQNPK